MIKYPGGDIAWWTLLFMLAGTYLSYDAFSRGNMVLASVFGILPMACVLIWLDIRAAKWFLVAYLAFVSVGLILMMTIREFQWRTFLKALTSAYGAYEFATWNGNPNAAPPADEFPLDEEQDEHRASSEMGAFSES